MAGQETHTATCPHCNRPFSAELLKGDAERHRGFKCPHCRLFVPLERVADEREAADAASPRG